MIPDLAHRRWAPRLSELHDGTLDATEATACRAHLAACSTCRHELQQIEQIVSVLRSHAATDAHAPVSPAVWQGIAAQLDAAVLTTPRPRRWWRTAAAAVLVAGSGLVLLQQRFPSATSRTTLTGAAPATTAPVVPAGAGQSPRQDAAVADLRSVLAEERVHLAPETVRVLERSLAVIDAAIAEAERAVAVDSADVYVASHLARVRARRLALLREAARLAQS